MLDAIAFRIVRAILAGGMIAAFLCMPLLANAAEIGGDKALRAFGIVFGVCFVYWLFQKD